ncbi:MAG TPA: hypothetical protein VFL42_14075 [Terriglobales bacterium]|nr:hypothetical protein [Terriglobales bacterium]
MPQIRSDDVEGQREERKVLRAYSRALPIHAKSGRERVSKARAREDGPQDDEC